MFKLQPNPTFFHTVEGVQPGGGEPLQLEFRHKDKDALVAYYQGAPGRDDYALVAEIVAGWRGVEVDFGEDALRALLNNYPAAAGRIVAAYGEALGGARLGN